MAITVSQATGNILAEYAATSINISRTVHNDNGIITPVFTAQIMYDRKDYLLDAQGNKVGIITANNPTPAYASENPYTGMIYLDQAAFGALFASMPDPAKSLGDQIADLADAQIHADLIKRGILSV